MKIMRINIFSFIVISMLTLVGCKPETPADDAVAPTAQTITPEVARVIAKEAYIYGYPMVDNLRVQYSYFSDKSDPEYKAPYNTLFNIPRVFTPDDKAIQTPNSDTPYS